MNVVFLIAATVVFVPVLVLALCDLFRSHETY